MSGRGVLCPIAHFQYVSDFTNNKGETCKYDFKKTINNINLSYRTPQHCYMKAVT